MYYQRLPHTLLCCNFLLFLLFLACNIWLGCFLSSFHGVQGICQIFCVSLILHFCTVLSYSVKLVLLNFPSSHCPSVLLVVL